ncbi:MAG TPA: suppressor of fused domain protein [Kofleriaceae bacterium]|jgi:tetratricopeptide (TPR) repeat protein|nr:suppressor of fused domain protein [Kofleriaceae bacterium]
MSQGAADALVVEANELFRAERFEEAAQRFQRATALFPPHPLAWKGLGHALLCLGKPHEAARAFDQAIGLKPDSATALWGGALAHAEIGNRVVAQNYLRRTLTLQPSWLAMAQDVAQLAPFLQISTRAADLLRAAFGAFSARTYRHAQDNTRAIEVGRIPSSPALGRWTFVTIGVSNTEWAEPQRPRVELVMASSVDTEICGQILANLGFHLSASKFFPEPGTMVRDVVGSLDAGELSGRLPHVYVKSPTAWGIHLPLDIGPPPITIAQVFPISEAEYQTWRKLGADRFERSLDDRNIDIADIRRSGV